jgi:hypothetical protein
VSLSKDLEDLRLSHVSLGSALEGSTVDEVKHHAVGQLLSVLIRRVGCAEFAQVEALGNTFRLLLGVSGTPLD